QIRANGEKKELVEETIALAKKYGIATPYTSYLIVPDGPVPVVIRDHGRPNVSFGAGGTTAARGAMPGGFGGGGFGGNLGGGLMLPTNQPAPKVVDFARQAQSKPGELAQNRGKLEDKKTEEVNKFAAGVAKGGGKDDERILALKEAGEKKKVYDEA